MFKYPKLYKVTYEGKINSEKVVSNPACGIGTKDESGQFRFYTWSDINKKNKNIFTHLLLAYDCTKKNNRVKEIFHNGVIIYEC